MNKIRTALISVWDKTGIVDFAKFLNKKYKDYFNRRHKKIFER